MRLWILLLVLTVVNGQPAFEVASIHPVAHSPGAAAINIGIRLDGAQMRANLSLTDLITNAFRVKYYQVSGPDWLASERFDVAATLPEGATPGSIPGMLRTLLVERFDLKSHLSKKDFPVYALEIGRGGLKMQESPGGAENSADKPAVDVGVTASGQGIAVNLGGGVSYSFTENKFDAHRLNMAEFVGSIERFLDRPVVDMTGLKGRYDFALNLTEEDYRSMLIRSAVATGVVLPPQALKALETGAPVSLFSAADRLGIHFDARKAPLDVVVVDSIRRIPTDN